jgi:hypothetical protein
MSPHPVKGYEPMNSPWDVGFGFDVGSTERHRVSFAWGQWRTEAAIFVDGTRVFRKRSFFAFRVLNRYEVTVGDHERHSVLIERTKPTLLGAFRQNSFRAFVDGQLVAQY